MYEFGVIGTGSMGSMLIRKFIETEVINANNIIANNRTKEKVISLSKETGIKTGENNQGVVKKSDIIFLCVKPLEVKGVLQDLENVLTPKKLLISIAADVSLENLLAWSNARVVKVIPSVTSECLKGVSLISFGNNATESDKNLIFSLFSAISRPIEIEEKNFELLADLTSCAPAFISSILREFALSATRRDDIPSELAELLVKETLAGTAELLVKNESSFDGIISKVATKGGITEEGVKVIQKQIPDLYDNLLEVTLAKHNLVKEKIKNQN
ncbi:pyrroline-5-carboxylate reductase [Candidatus Brocadiaceae bacterium]|nr:pyrroline-5-carboxylate reductase [Candidatus Brocadiaceae bacterium]